MALIAALTFALIAGTGSLKTAASLSEAADILQGSLSQGHDLARTQNIPIEVRLYDLAGSAGEAPAYRAFQLHALKPDGTRPAMAKVIYLPAGIIIDATATHSTLVASDPVTAQLDPTDPNMNAQTRVFHYLPDGSTDLTPGQPWFLTVRSATQSDPAHFPSDWVSIEIDPVTGRLQLFRP